MTINLKISTCSYQQLCAQTSCGTVQEKHPVPAHSPQPSTIYIYIYIYIYSSEPARYRSKPTASHQIKTIQSLTLVAAIALLFLVGKYAATYTVLAGTVRGVLV